MKLIKVTSFLTLFLVTFLSMASNEPTSVEVFTTKSLLKKVVDVNESAKSLSVYIIDNISFLEAEASNSLPQITKEETTSQEGLERYKERVHKQVIDLAMQQAPAIQNAWDGLTKTILYRLKEVPAVVIDGEYVVYGISVSNAVTAWKRETDE